MAVVCAWCGKQLSGSGENVSHGICEPCTARFENHARRAAGREDGRRQIRRRVRRLVAPTLPLPGFEALFAI